MLKKFQSIEPAYAACLSAGYVFGLFAPLVLLILSAFSANTFQDTGFFRISVEMLALLHNCSVYLTIAAITYAMLVFSFKKAFFVLLPAILFQAVLFIKSLIPFVFAAGNPGEYYFIELVTTISAGIVLLCKPLLWAGVTALVKLIKLNEKSTFYILCGFFVLFGEGMVLYGNIMALMQASGQMMANSLPPVIITSLLYAAVYFGLCVLFYRYFPGIMKKFDRAPVKNK